MARTPRAPERSPARYGCWLLLWAWLPGAVMADWSVRPRSPEDPPGSHPVARILAGTDPQGPALEVLMDAQEVVWVQWTATTPTPGICPTVDIDAGSARLHRPVGPDCVWSGSRVRLRAGAHAGPGLPSPFLFALVNGKSVVVRHAEPGGLYREQRFALKGSKRAVKAAVADLRIFPR